MTTKEAKISPAQGTRRSPASPALATFDEEMAATGTSFAEFSRAVTQGGSSILTDVLVEAGGGAWFDVAERADLQSLLQERQIIQNTHCADGQERAELPPLRFAGVLLNGSVIGLTATKPRTASAQTTSAFGGNVSYHQDVVSVALRAFSGQTGRALASVTTTKIIYSLNVGGNAFQFAAVDAQLQADIGVTKSSPRRSRFAKVCNSRSTPSSSKALR